MIDLGRPNIRCSASFDRLRIYRYLLTRTWDGSLPAVTWVMLNPSTADERNDDPTISRVVGFARKWGYGSARVVNLFALRATRPAQLRESDDPVGPDNDAMLSEVLNSSGTVVAAWGNHGDLPNPATGEPRCNEMWSVLHRSGVDVACLRITKRGQPAHPLYLPGDTRPESLSHRYTPR